MRPTPSGITVVGRAAASTTADRLRLRVAVEHTHPRAAAALSASSDSARRLRLTLQEAGIPDTLVQTVGLSLDQQWTEPGKIAGYVARQRFSAVVADLSNAGSLLEQLGSDLGDALRVEGVEVFADDPRAAADVARADAFEDARRQASALAGQAGRTLGAVRSVITSLSGTEDALGGQARLMAKADAFAPGEVVVTESVRVSWDWAEPTA